MKTIPTALAAILLTAGIAQAVPLKVPVCGNATVDAGEECETEDLQGETCLSQGFEGGNLGCATGCQFDTSGCLDQRYDASGDTIVDLETGLDWEKLEAHRGLVWVT